MEQGLPEFKSADDILDYAIQREEEARQFYTELAERQDLKHLREALLEFAVEESRHKAKLENVKNRDMSLSAQNTVVNLKLADTLPDVDPSQKDLSYADALVLAMKAEKAAYRLYYELSQVVEDAALKELFVQLAQEEARHKLRFEIEYDEYVLKEN